ncbi:MAG TPA: class I SAM-dependent methyltransferase [Bacteroidia bacterium]|jgi:16S rRNA (cytosine967-C5)-methyltransferase|nr:class I SAM-dependent methyltransferase [Bacteroidia bacterium]
MDNNQIEVKPNIKDRLHANLIRAVIEALQQVFGNDKYADAVVRSMLKSNPKWGSKDRKFLAETVYETVRWWRKLWAIYGKEPELSEQKLWRLLGIYFHLSGYELPTWKEFDGIKERPLDDILKEVESNRVLRESIPDWLDEIGNRELGDKWERELRILNETAPVIIRANTLKASIAQLQRSLKDEDVESKYVPLHPDALQLDVRQNIFRTQCFSNGWFEVQDASSQEVAYFMDVKPGMRVVDACAGGGGKALHIAALMQNKGKILALDLHEWKLKEMQKRAVRAGVSIIEPRPITSSKVIKRMEKTADRLLLDVPCSGLGVLRRNPDLKWKLSKASIDRITIEQINIITSYSKMAKVGGRVIYATCSILPSENEHVVDKFLSANTDFKKIAEKKILPSESGHDGFYMASIERIA